MHTHKASTVIMNCELTRQLTSEILDHLAPNDPRAIRSRKDLQRINRIMGSAGIIAGALRRAPLIPRRLLELGAGDGSLMLRLAQRLVRVWPHVHVTLLDREELVTDQVRDGFQRLGWSCEVAKKDVATWIEEPDAERWDITVANLFIHHFDTSEVVALFNALQARTDLFIACEPRRAHLPLIASRLVGLIGANSVTRTDAVLSVRAGFDGAELSGLWPDVAGNWALEERAARAFSHLFIASRRT